MHHFSVVSHGVRTLPGRYCSHACSIILFLCLEDMKHVSFLREEALWELVTFEVTCPCALDLPPGIFSIGIPCCAPFWQTAFVGNWQSKTEHQTTNLQHSLQQKIIGTFNMQHPRGVSSLEGSIAVGGEDPINLAGFCRLESHSCKEFVPKLLYIFPLALFVVRLRHIESMGLSNFDKMESGNWPSKRNDTATQLQQTHWDGFPKVAQEAMAVWSLGEIGRAVEIVMTWRSSWSMCRRPVKSVIYNHTSWTWWFDKRSQRYLSTSLPGLTDSLWDIIDSFIASWELQSYMSNLVKHVDRSCDTWWFRCLSLIRHGKTDLIHILHKESSTHVPSLTTWFWDA